MSQCAIEVCPYRLRFRAPFATAHGVLRHRSGLLVRASDGAGNHGYGDVAPLYGFGVSTPGDAREALRRAVAVLACADLCYRPESAAGLKEIGRALAGSDGAPGLTLAGPTLAGPTLAGLTLALADLAARARGQALASWLEPGAAGLVGVNAVIGLDSPESAVRSALQAVARGFSTVKLKLGGGETEDIARVAAVRMTVGPEVALRLDANGAWTESEAVGRLARLAPYGIEFVEQPVRPADIDGLARVRRQSDVPIAADESLLVPDGPRRVLDLGAADVLVLKPSLIGGIAVAGQIARSARAQGLAFVVTTALESAIGRLGALHLAAALCGAGQDHDFGLATGGMLADDVADAPEPVGGRLAVPDGPGLGAVPSGVFELL